MPALPLHAAGKYVAAAYIVFFVLVLIYVAIMALRLSHLERDLGELLTLADRQNPEDLPSASPPPAPVGVGAHSEGPDDA
jgi:hypothetical protein